MKRFWIIIVSIFVWQSYYAQEKRNFSVEGDFCYYRGFQGAYIGKFNHGYSLLLSKYVGKLKMSTGINYSIFAYAENFSESIFHAQPIRKEYRIEYLNFPVILQPNLYSGKKYRFSLVAGVLFNRPLRHETKIFASDPAKNQTIVSYSAVKQGLTLMGGFSISRNLNEHFEVYLTPFVNYRTGIGLNGDNYPDYLFIQESNLLQFGGKISLEYLF